MSMQITPDLENLVRDILAQGKFEDETDVLRRALELLQRRETLIREVNAGVAQLDEGKYVEYDDESLDRFLDDVR